jgi:PqqA peptide cyclase
MVLNVVLHRMNIDHVKEILEMAESMEAEYVELANTQYYGWAMLNRDHLLPSHEQIQRAEQIVNEFRQRVGDKMKIYFVVPDYYETRPKACMNGWGSVFITVTADGVVLPCHEARMLPGITFPNVRDTDLKSIWYDSQAFNEYRGDSWMKEPCRTCPEKAKDFGGCRCQAFMLTGDAKNADPVCSLSPHHHVIHDAISQSQRTVAQQNIKTIPIIFRDDANSRIYGKPPVKQLV